MGAAAPWYPDAADLERIPLGDVVLPEVRGNDLDDVPRRGNSQRLARKYHARLVDKGEWPAAVRAYLAAVTALDRQVGRLLAALEDSGRAKNAVVVLTSDHGQHLGQKQHWGAGTLWEESTHVPLIVKAPGGEPGRSTTFVSSLDLYPTLSDLCSLTSRQDHEGESLKPGIDDPTFSWERTVLTSAGRGNNAIRSPRWRYIRYHLGTKEVYDHEADPHEWDNVGSGLEGMVLLEVQTLMRALPRAEVEPVGGLGFTPPGGRAGGKPKKPRGQKRSGRGNGSGEGAQQDSDGR